MCVYVCNYVHLNIIMIFFWQIYQILLKFVHRLKIEKHNINSLDKFEKKLEANSKHTWVQNIWNVKQVVWSWL
jgi:hypothetical protein